MVLQYYVVENATGKQIEIDIESATNEDLTSTKEKWQSDWTSEFIRDPKLEKYAAKTDAGEIVALGAYREDDHGISVFIANIEAHPESNPTISTGTGIQREFARTVFFPTSTFRTVKI